MPSSIDKFTIAANESTIDLLASKRIGKFTKEAVIMIAEIMRGEVNSEDECEKFLRAFAPKMLAAHYPKINLPSSRALVCCFCGKSWSYDGYSPMDPLLKEAYEHEAACEKNPYLAQINELTFALHELSGLCERAWDGMVVGKPIRNLAKQVLSKYPTTPLPPVTTDAGNDAPENNYASEGSIPPAAPISLPVVETLNKLPEVTWDRFAGDGVENVGVYGWLPRDDGKSDYVLVMIDKEGAWLISTSSAKYSADFSARLGMGGDSHTPCRRVEDYFEVVRCVRLADSTH